MGRLFVLPISNIHKMAGHCSGCGHGGGYQMSAAAATLATLEVPVARRRAALTRFKLVGIHCQAHAAAGFAPFETGFAKDLIEPLTFGLNLHLSASGHDHGLHMTRHAVPFDDRSG